jgi:hypothetical protein
MATRPSLGTATLADILAALPAAAGGRIDGDARQAVSSVTHDSRAVQP